MNTTIIHIETYLKTLQQSICDALSKEDGKIQFALHPWEKESFGFGVTAVLERGQVIEKGGVNFSHVYGNALPPAATSARPALAGSPFHALGLSVVIHPDNPYIPTSHANVRFFIAEPKDSAPVWWFGGGYDLTPYYGFEEDCTHWHRVAKEACLPFGDEVYPEYKKGCDTYFYLKHRDEPRGIGGLFFDDLNKGDLDTCFRFMKSVGDSYLKAYLPIFQKRKTHSYGEREKTFQRYRRGRYVEFNLLYDRGTHFGLQSQGRVEAILMSMPPEVNWTYHWRPEPGSKEAELYEKFLICRDWV